MFKIECSVHEIFEWSTVVLKVVFWKDGECINYISVFIIKLGTCKLMWV